MKYKLLPLISLLFCISCYSQPRVNATHNKRYFNDGATLKMGGEISKEWAQCKLIEVRKTMMGYRHLFVSDSLGILIRHFNQPLATDSCYFVKLKN